MLIEMLGQSGGYYVLHGLTNGLIASGPAALEILRPERSLLTPAVEILISCMIGHLYCRLSGNRLTREFAPFNKAVGQSFIKSRGMDKN